MLWTITDDHDLLQLNEGIVYGFQEIKKKLLEV